MRLIHSIRKVQKELFWGEGVSVSKETCHALEQFLLVLLKDIIRVSLDLMKYSRRKRLSDTLLDHALHACIPKGITGCVQECIQMPYKSALYFAGATTKRNIRELVPDDVVIEHRFVVGVSFLLQFVCAELFELAAIQTIKDDAARINVQQFMSAIRNDEDMYTLYHSLRMVLLTRPNDVDDTPRVRVCVLKNTPIHPDAVQLIEYWFANM